MVDGPDDELARQLREGELRYGQLQSSLGAFVQQWNLAEHRLRLAMLELAGGGRRAEILCTHMSGPATCDALLAFCDAELVSEHLVGRIRHAVKYHRALSGWRNYFVHEPIGGGYSYNPTDNRVRASTVAHDKRRGGVQRGAILYTEQLVEGSKWASILAAQFHWVEILAADAKADQPKFNPDEYRAAPLPDLPPPWRASDMPDH